ncbi:MAG: aldo/keto reductase [Spirochaetales bacterium]|nr:aldo/keto reductase [Spirochaetales bacterium]
MMNREMHVLKRTTSALGMGCWAVGGEWTIFGAPAGWGKTDDAESIRAIEAAYDSGIRLFDTAANYGVGLSEELLGKALGGKRRECVISTKFGFKLEHESKNVSTYGERMETSDVKTHIKRDCEESLKRLKTDYIDVYFFHIWDYDKTLAQELVRVLEDLVSEGKIRSFGWSTDDVELASLWTKSAGYSSVQFNLNVSFAADEMLGLIDREGLNGFNRAPLAMGFLTGKYNQDSVFSATDNRNSEWVKDTFRKPVLSRIDSLKEVLTSGGRTLAQGSLSWIWAKSPNTFPIPGIRTEAQAKENARAMEFGPFSDAHMRQIDEILGCTGS